MKYILLIFNIISVILYIKCEDFKIYKPTWDSLDSRPLPQWYDDAKIGIFLHWGVYSVPSFGSEWFWINWKSNVTKYVEFMAKNYKPNFTYQDFARDFTTEFFNASQWASIFSSSGAKYIVLTSKHHEGYTLWPSRYSYSWNSVDIGPRKDLIGELSSAIRKETDLKFGLYHSLFEWFHPMYLSDKQNKFYTKQFSLGKIIPEMKELIKNYKPDVLWSDGDWEAHDDYWYSKEFLAWLYNDSPVSDTVVVNDRWGIDIPCHHGDFYTCTDRFNPGVLQKHKWENAMTIDKKSWGYRRNADLSDYMSIEELIKELITTVSCGGNLNMNIGPTKEGTIIPIFQERLSQVGTWLKHNGEAIYSSKPWIFQNDTISEVWYTSKGSITYATMLRWPEDNVLVLGSVNSLFDSNEPVVTMLGTSETKLIWTLSNNTVHVQLPDKEKVMVQWAWVLKIVP